MIPRLYVAGDHHPGDTIELGTEQAHYLGQVLRLQVDAPLRIFNGAGFRADARLISIQRQRAQVIVDSVTPGNRLGPLRITLVQSVSAADKMDWTVEKATELGVAVIVPIVTRRSKVRLDADRAQRRQDHWHRLIVAACMQSERDEIVALHALTSIEALADRLDPTSHRLVLAPPRADRVTTRLSSWLPTHDEALAPDAPLQVVVLTGPESGFDDDEVEQAVRLGFQPISLGPRILRTETAGLAAIAALQTRFGDL